MRHERPRCALAALGLYSADGTRLITRLKLELANVTGARSARR